jgi:signal transduction histidine kinase
MVVGTNAGVPERASAPAGVRGGEPVVEPVWDGLRGWEQDPGSVRRWLARELHDGVVQTLTAMLVELELLKGEHRGTAVAPRLDSIQGRTREVLGGLRHLVCEVRGEPGDVEDFEGRVAALLGGFESATGIRCRLTTSPSWPTRLAAPVAFHLHRIVEEALRNVRYHSGALQVTLELGTAGRHLVLTVADDGQGIDWLPGPARATGMGMLGMQERAVILGGHLTVSSPPQGGTTVTVVVEPDVRAAWL